MKWSFVYKSIFVHQSQACVLHYVAFLLTTSSRTTITSPPHKLDSIFSKNYSISLWIPTRIDVNNKWNLPWIRMEMRSWTYFEQGKAKNMDSIIRKIASNHLFSMVNNIGSLLVVMAAHKNLDFLAIDFE